MTWTAPTVGAERSAHLVDERYAALTGLGKLLKGLIVVPPLAAFGWLVAEVILTLFGFAGLMSDWAVLAVFLVLVVLRAVCFDLPLPRRIDAAGHPDVRQPSPGTAAPGVRYATIQDGSSR